MNTIKIVAALFLLSLAYTGISQNTTFDGNRVALYLHSGSRIQGKLIECVLPQYISLTLNNIDTIKIDYKLIKRFDISDEVKIKLQSFGLFMNKKWMASSSISALPNGSRNGISVQQSFLVSHIDRLFYGPTIGVSNFSENSAENIYNIGVDTRYFLVANRSSPFVYCKVGYGQAIAQEKYNQTDTGGGMYYNPGVGLAMGSKFAIDLYIGMRFQRAQFVYQANNTESTVNRNAKRLELGIGFSF